MTKLSQLPKNSPLIKAPFGGLTSNMLRLLAVLFMVSDHVWATYMSFGDWMTNIGRMAFPIFAFQIAEGYVVAQVILSTHNDKIVAWSSSAEQLNPKVLELIEKAKKEIEEYM